MIPRYEELYNQLIEIRDTLLESDKDKQNLLKKAKSIKEELDKMVVTDKESLCQINVIYGDIMSYSANKENALKFFNKALEYAINDDCYSMVYCYIGKYYDDIENIEKAIKYYNKVLLLTNLTDKQYYHSALSNLGYISGNKKLYQQSNKYFIKLIEDIDKPTTENEKRAYQTALSSVASNFWDNGEERKAEEYLEILFKLSDVEEWILSISYSDRGHYYYTKSIWWKAIEDYKKALEYAETEDDKKDYLAFIDYCEKQIKKIGGKPGDELNDGK